MNEGGPDEVAVTIPGKRTMATKQRELSSDVLGTGNTINRFNDVKQSIVVDLDLKDLPQNINEEDLKKVSGAKHVIVATIDQDSIRNVCTGTGRIKLRLTDGDDVEQVKL